NLVWLRHNEKALKQDRLEVETDLHAVTKVLQWFEDFTKPMLPQPSQSQCQLAFVEGFTNAVRHAHHNLPPTTPIELELKVFPDSLEMRIWDQGQPFDLETKLQEALDRQKDLDPLSAVGGRGLIFMHQLMDEVAYLRVDDDRNCLLMRKRY
ncbi:ATP-binding protein, partial [Allocoleopsis sp.]|uniref:ATP-binding protein n=1 Tax=Allocoleopsis sp. TaxID=3088169 RepID=UPI002FCEADB2